MPAPPPESEAAIVTAQTGRRSFGIGRRERIAPLFHQDRLLEGLGMRFSRFGTVRLAPLLLLAAWPLAAADELTPFDVARIRTVGSIAISPDGSRIAYTLSVPRRVLDEEDGEPGRSCTSWARTESRIPSSRERS